MTHPLHQKKLASLAPIKCIELRATRVTSHDIDWCLSHEATMFSIYIGALGSYEWVADFEGYDDAREWAEVVARTMKLTLIDYVEKEKVWTKPTKSSSCAS